MEESFDDFFAVELAVTKSYREEEVPTDLHPAVPQFLGSLSSEELQALNRADLITPQTPVTSQWRDATGYDTWEGEPVERPEMLRRLAVEDKVELRRNIHLFGLDLEVIETNMEQEQFLEFCRDIRRAYPSGNIISKRQQMQAEGLTLDKFDFEELYDEDIVFFGNAHVGHKACLTPGVMVNVDPASTEEAPGFVTGKLQEWRKFVEEYDATAIMSDASVGDQYGFVYDHSLTPHYREIYEEGYDLVYKNHIAVEPVGNVIDWRKVCPHNEEIVVWVSNHRKPIRPYPGKARLLRDNKLANVQRTKRVILRNHKFRWKNSCWVHFLPKLHPRFMPNWGWVKRKAVNRFDNVNPVTHHEAAYVRRCLRPTLGTEVPVNITLEFPSFFTDLVLPPGTPSDLFNLAWSSATRQGYLIEFDAELGWYAE